MIRVLFVCAGNICRSPTAEAVVRRVLHDAKLADAVEVDSAGIHGYHFGEAPDRRAQRVAASRGYDLSGQRARQVGAADFCSFDLILAMDKNCLAALKRLCPAGHSGRLGLFMAYAKDFDADDVPDPYYGTGASFDLVLDMVEDAANGLIAILKREGGSARPDSIL